MKNLQYGFCKNFIICPLKMVAFQTYLSSLFGTQSLEDAYIVIWVSSPTLSFKSQPEWHQALQLSHFSFHLHSSHFTGNEVTSLKFGVKASLTNFGRMLSFAYSHFRGRICDSDIFKMVFLSIPSCHTSLSMMRVVPFVHTNVI